MKIELVVVHNFESFILRILIPYNNKAIRLHDYTEYVQNGGYDFDEN